MSPSSGFKVFKAGDVLFHQGDVADVAYYVLAGRVEVTSVTEGVKRLVAVVPPLGIVGEMALLDPAPRMATATVLESTNCRPVSREAFAKLIEATPVAALQVLRSLIRTARLKVGLPAMLEPRPEEAERLLREATVLTERRLFLADKPVFRAGDEADGIYLVQSGEVEIRDPTTGARLRTFLPGEAFGERGLFERTGRSADAFATLNTACEFIDTKRFGALLKDTPPVILGLIRAYVKEY